MLKDSEATTFLQAQWPSQRDTNYVLGILKMYLHTNNEVSKRYGFQKLDLKLDTHPYTDRQTDRQM